MPSSPDSLPSKSKEDGSVFKFLANLVRLLLRIRLINFMAVGGVGYVINIAFYYPLTLLFKNHVLLLGQQFYLPPLVVSSLIAITSNYYFNKIFTFRRDREYSLGYLKYLGTCLVTLPFDVVFVFLFVHYLHFIPTLALAVAILIVFLLRYFVISHIVWTVKKS